MSYSCTDCRDSPNTAFTTDDRIADDVVKMTNREVIYKGAAAVSCIDVLGMTFDLTLIMCFPQILLPACTAFFEESEPAAACTCILLSPDNTLVLEF